MVTCTPVMFVNVNVVEAPAPDAAATATAPAVALAVIRGAVATPVASVTAEATFAAPAKATAAPVEGAVNVTVAFGTGLPPASLTNALRGAAYAVAMVADCPLPETTVTVAGAPGVFVREISALTTTPGAEAITP